MAAEEREKYQEAQYFYKESTEFVVPQRRIFNSNDLQLFCEASEAHHLIWSFIVRLNSSVKGIETPPLDPVDHFNLDFVSTAVGPKSQQEKEQLGDKTTAKEPDESVMLPAKDPLLADGLCKMLDLIRDSVELFPPVDNSKSRFGNPAFRDFYDHLCENIGRWHLEIFNFNSPQSDGYYLPVKALPELGQYLCESFGNRTRIDYGSGHELNFMSWLLCLDRLGLFLSQNHQDQIDRALVLRVFVKYLSVMRLIQATYWLEPAGSHGVWGLDDYHFLPYMFGSSQLEPHKYLKPRSIHDKDILDMFSDRYLYLNCVLHINKVKTSASLRWHSPMLDDISGVKTWSKVNQGMRKMYLAEVLGKLPVMQHYKFGTSIPCNPHQSYTTTIGEEKDQQQQQQQEDDHHHHDEPNSWASCCGIKVPSAIAVAMSAAATQTPSSSSNIIDGPKARPLPFD